MLNASRLRPLVSEVLFREWDPLGVKNDTRCRDEYDHYIPGILRLLLDGTDEHQLVARLCQLEHHSMGLGIGDEERARRVARCLLSVVSDRHEQI